MRTSLAGIILLVALLVPGVAMAQRLTWVAVLLVYKAPADAIDWRGPWTRGMIVAGKNFFASESACQKDTEGWIARTHQEMKTPILFRCVPFQESLHKSNCSSFWSDLCPHNRGCTLEQYSGRTVGS